MAAREGTREGSPPGYAPVVAYDIHIRTVDGGVQYPNALSYGIQDQMLWVQVGVDPDESDKSYFSPGYWQQYVVDPHSDDPLGLDELGLDALASLGQGEVHNQTKLSVMRR